MCHDVQILNMCDFLVERGELVEMSRKETECPDVGCDMSKKVYFRGSQEIKVGGTYSEIAHASPKPS